MLRGNLSSLAAAAMRMVNFSGNAAYHSAIPVFRSDRGVGAGGRIVLAGVEKTANTRTLIIVQELGGASGSADVQSYDANGTAIGPKATMTMGAFFSSVDSGNTVVEGARSVVITNTGSSRINAYARVIDSSTSDTFAVTDPSA